MDTKHTRGFTLVESVVTLAVASTLLSIGISTLGDLLHGLRLASVSNAVLQQLHLARSEAIKRNGRMALCKSADGATCSDGGGWEQGWILFQDLNNSGTREPQEPVQQRLEPLPPQFLLKANSPLARYVSYGPLGATMMASGAFQAGTFTLCRLSAGPGEGRQIIINAGGRPRSQKVQLENCM
ncbi:MAG: methylation [Ramlibacter sp.]|nr:methylation [Ramlibacter sp.]